MKPDAHMSGDIPHAIALAPASATDALELLAARGVTVHGNPDVRVFESEELYVDDVRELLSFAALKPLHDRKYLIMSFSRANQESQNALLKAVEESLGGTTFIFTLESIGHLIPTLRSRVTTIKSDSKEPDTLLARTFLDEAYPERMTRIEKMALQITKTQDKREAKEFLKALLFETRRRRLGPAYIRDVLTASEYLRLQGASAKSLLGHLAVTLPRG